MKKKKKSSKAASKKVSKKKAKKKAAKKSKMIKAKAKKSDKKTKRIKVKAKKKTGKATQHKTKKGPSQAKSLSLVPPSPPLKKPKEVTYSQESTRPLPGGFESQRTQVTEGDGHVEIDQETFSYQENVDLGEEGEHEEEDTLSEEEDLLDNLEDDSDLPPHLR